MDVVVHLQTGENTIRIFNAKKLKDYVKLELGYKSIEDFLSDYVWWQAELLTHNPELLHYEQEEGN